MWLGGASSESMSNGRGTVLARDICGRGVSCDGRTLVGPHGASVNPLTGRRD